MKKTFHEHKGREQSSDRLRQLLKDKESDLDELCDKKYEIKNNSRRKEKELSREIEGNEQDIKELKEDRKHNQAKLAEYKVIIKGLNTKIADLDRQLQLKRDEARMKKKKLPEGLSQIEKINQLEKYKTDKAKLENEIKNLNDRIEYLKMSKNELKNSITSTEEIKNDAMVRLKMKIDEHLESKKTFEDEISTLTDEIEKYKDLEVKAQDKADHYNKLMSNQELTIDNHNVKIRSLERELSESERSFPPSTTDKYFTRNPADETISMAATKPSLTSPALVTVTSDCPNCHRSFAVTDISNHLERCLEEYS